MAGTEAADPDDEFFKKVYGDGYKPQTREEREEEERARERERERQRELRKRGRERERDRTGDEDEGAVPKDFRSKYSRAQDDRARAVERHYNRRREEDLTCRNCGEKGHPTQGCPKNLGSGRRPAGPPPFTMLLNDRRLRARLIGTGGAVIQGLEKECHCRIRLEDNPAPGAVEGSFVVRVMGADQESIEKGGKLVREMVARIEEEMKNRPPRPAPAGGGGGGGQPPVFFPGVHGPGMVPMGTHPFLMPHPGYPPPDGMHPFGAPPAQWDPQAAHFYFGANGGPGPAEESAQEEKGQEDMEVGYEEAKAARGGSPLPDTRARRQGPPQPAAEAGPHEAPPASGAWPDAAKVPGTLEELESLAVQETADLEAAQSKDEDEEHGRHLERLAEIAAAYQERRAALSERLAQRRRTFFRLQSLMASNTEAEQPSPARDAQGRGAGASLAPSPAPGYSMSPHEHRAQPASGFSMGQHEHMAQAHQVSQAAAFPPANESVGMAAPYMHYSDQPFGEPTWGAVGGPAQAPASHWPSYASALTANSATDYNANLCVPHAQSHAPAPYAHSYMLP